MLENSILPKKAFFCAAGGIAPAGATKGHENKRSLRSPFGNLRRRCFWGYLRLILSVSWINTRAQHENALNSIARKGQGTNSLAKKAG
jgi:hypothetical protein